MKVLWLFLSTFIFLSCNPGFESKTVSGEALGTTYHITYFSDTEFPVEQGLDSLFEAINQSMSTYRDSSDISRINSGDSTVVVDEMFRDVFFLSLQVHEQSGGYFDPTVGDLVNLYGFGPEKRVTEIDTAAIDSLMEFVGFSKLRLDPKGRVEKANPQVYLDFNAIAKGYTVDVIGNYLEKQGVTNYLVELGGELLSKGRNLTKDAPWTVGIDDPQQTEGQRLLKVILQLKDRGMATSGNYRKFRIDSNTGEKYVHTINPITGFPEKSNLLSATVLAESCALADGYATAFMAMGLESSKQLVKDLEEVEAYFIFSLPDGRVGEFFSPGFQQFIVETSQ